MCVKCLKIDDVVDAVAVHGACGLWGVIALGLFGNPDEEMGGNGVLYGGDQLGTQLIAACLIVVRVSVLSLAVFLPLKYLGMLRLSDAFQDVGADAMEHSPRKSYTSEDASRKSARSSEIDSSQSKSVTPADSSPPSAQNPASEKPSTSR